MPFTPFHFGPGLLLKSVAPRRVSVASYAAVNVVIDLESLYHLARHELTVHRWAHTFAGAGTIGLAVGLLLAVICRAAADPRWIGRHGFSDEFAAGPLVLGAVLGGLTHPLLDGMMHFDIHPFRPFSSGNPLLGAVTIGMIEAGCVASAVMGALVLFSRRAPWGAVACLLLIVPAAARVQIANNGHLRLGDVARSLSDPEVDDLERAARANGIAPWLFNGPRGQLADMQAIEACGTPAFPVPGLARGALVTLVRRHASATVWGPWTLASKAAFAQVAVPGKAFTRIEDDHDINRPFRVVGEFADAEIVELVTLIRSSPAGPGGGDVTVRGRWPIRWIARENDGSVSVFLHEEDLSGQRITLRRQADSWTIVSVGFWVA